MNERKPAYRRVYIEDPRLRRIAECRSILAKDLCLPHNRPKYEAELENLLAQDEPIGHLIARIEGMLGLLKQRVEAEMRPET